VPASRPLIYLDACAATPLAEGLGQRLLDYQQQAWANPSSLHPAGLAAAELLERSRQRLLELLECPNGQVVFTSGGTEADNLALFGVCRRQTPGRLLISAFEHAAIGRSADQLRAEGWQVEILPLDHHGRIDLQALEGLLVPPTRLVSVAWASSELGVLQPMEAISRLCHRAGVPLHSDAVQVVGQLPVAQLLPLPVDLLSISAHKFQGPRGVGALVMPKPQALQAQLLGGGQESGLRSGTESPWLVAAMVDALECRFNLQPQLAEAMADLRDELWQRLAAVAGLERVGRWRGSECLPHHLAVLLSSVEGEPLSARAAVRQLAQAGVAVSSGSACSSGTDQANPALLALGYNPRQARSGLRFSVGPWLQPQDFIGLPPLLESVLRQLPTVELP